MVQIYSCIRMVGYLHLCSHFVIEPYVLTFRKPTSTQLRYDELRSIFFYKLKQRAHNGLRNLNRTKYSSEEHATSTTLLISR
jgi:hypothetical protein